MRYIQKTNISEIQSNYDLIIGWGNSIVEFECYYNPSRYHLDYLINGQGNGCGKIVCGCEVKAPDVLESARDKRVCAIIFPNIEAESLQQIHTVLPNADTIVGRLVEAPGSIIPHNYAASTEDLIFVDLIEKLGIMDPVYMDIGVCHPIIRNNTYLLYEKGWVNGILVEPNPVMAELCTIYRPENKLLNMGACAGKDRVLQYVSGKAPGANHFLKENEMPGKGDQVLTIGVKNINDIIRENVPTSLDILDIDIEGMDYDALEALDVDSVEIKIICAEYKSRFEKRDMRALMQGKGYIHYMSTKENHIYLKETEMNKISGRSKL